LKINHNNKQTKKTWDDRLIQNEWSNELNCGDHSVSQPIPMQRRPGSFPSNEAAGGLLSPKSAENLGLKLINYILEDNSPAVKEIDSRFKKMNFVSDLFFSSSSFFLIYYLSFNFIFKLRLLIQIIK
jgi:hypothetical protein